MSFREAVHNIISSAVVHFRFTPNGRRAAELVIEIAKTIEF